MDIKLLNNFPKKINLEKYLTRIDCNFNLEEPVYGCFLINTTRDGKFRVSYASYGYDGIEGYFPMDQESIEMSKDYHILFGAFEKGGFIGDDFEELISKMKKWLQEEGYYEEV